MQWIIFAAVIIFYIYRFYKNMKKQMAENEERKERQFRDPSLPTTTQEQPQTIEDVLTEVFREVETKTKPFAQPAPPKSFQQKQFEPLKKKFPQTITPQVVKQRLPKKEPTPFLTSDYSPEAIEPEGTPAHLREDYMKSGEITDIYNADNKKNKPLPKFNVRDAVIANIILTRPEW